MTQKVNSYPPPAGLPTHNKDESLSDSTRKKGCGCVLLLAVFLVPVIVVVLMVIIGGKVIGGKADHQTIHSSDAPGSGIPSASVSGSGVTATATGTNTLLVVASSSLSLPGVLLSASAATIPVTVVNTPVTTSTLLNALE